MEIIYNKCCGLDVHKKVLVADLRSRGGKGKTETRSFGTSTEEVTEMIQWLLSEGCEMVAMESTASYWKPVYNLCEQMNLPAMVVNAQHIKQVPGRKTDVNDAQWISDLLLHGLLSPSLIPDKRHRELREICVERKKIQQAQAAEKNRVQKVLEGGNVKISGTVNDVFGKSGRNLINVVMTGVPITEQIFDSMVEARMVSTRLKAPKEQILRDINGSFSRIQLKTLETSLSLIDTYTEKLQDLDDFIDQEMTEEEKNTRIQLEKVPGIGKTLSAVIIAVVGDNVSRFPDEKHFCSWLGLACGNNQSAGKNRSGRTTKGNNLLRTCMIIGAWSAARSKQSYFHAQYMRLCRRKNKKKAIVAVAHSMAIAAYHILKGEEFRDLGANYYEQQSKEKAKTQAIKSLASLGYEVQITSPTA